MREVHYRVHYNSASPVDLSLLVAVGKEYPEWLSGCSSDETAGEVLLDAYMAGRALPDKAVEWCESAISWMPRDSFEWWLGQFNSTNPAINAEPPARWLTQLQVFVDARYEGAAIGAAGVTKDYGRTSHSDAQPGGYFNVLRGMVVAPEFRRSHNKIGTRLVEERISAACNLGGILTIAATTNPDAGRIYESTGGTPVPVFSELGRVACWCLEPPIGCDQCPINNKTLWSWPADEVELAIRRAGIAA